MTDNSQQYKRAVGLHSFHNDSPESSQSDLNILITKLPNNNINTCYPEEFFQYIGTKMPRPSSERVTTHLSLDYLPHTTSDVTSLRNVPLRRMIFPNATENIDNGSDYTRNYSNFSEFIKNPQNLEENSNNEASFSFMPKNDIKSDFSFKNTLENNNITTNIKNTVETENNPPYYDNQIINVENNFGEYYNSSISENHINMPYETFKDNNISNNFEDNTQYYISDYYSNNANINDFQIDNIIPNNNIQGNINTESQGFNENFLNYFPADQTYINDYHNNYQYNGVDSLSTKIDKLIESQKLSIESNKKNIDNLVGGISLLAKNQNQLTADVKSLSTDVKSLSTDVKSLSTDIRSLASTQETLSRNIASLISTQQTLSGNISSLVEQLKKE